MQLAKVSTSLELRVTQETRRPVSLKMAMLFGIVPTILLILSHIQA